MHWTEVKDGHPVGLQLARRHYSSKFSRSYRKSKKPSKLFVGPGQRLVLLTACGRALFAWRFCRPGGRAIYGGYEGIYCTIFRNEGYEGCLSSDLIREAVELARQRWPEATSCFTFVDPGSVASRNPGFCFKKAGWQPDGFTKQRGLLILRPTFDGFSA